MPNWCFHIPQDKEETATSGGAGAAAGASTDGPSDEENLQMLDTMMQDPNIQVALPPLLVPLMGQWLKLLHWAWN